VNVRRYLSLNLVIHGSGVSLSLISPDISKIWTEKRNKVIKNDQSWAVWMERKSRARSIICAGFLYSSGKYVQVTVPDKMGSMDSPGGGAMKKGADGAGEIDRWVVSSS
jgi:hypothetical protein